MGQLNESHFTGMHTFRLEWQPGEDGYLRWYMDDDFQFGIDGAGLKKQQTQIPNEPSYVILNTAISTSWGFPNPPPGCTEYDCKDPAKQCGMNPGWCKTLPAEFKIDYVRVYQNSADSKQTIGCNPREYPTKRYIKAHEYRYKGLTEKHALVDVVTGGGECVTDDDCGSAQKSGVCEFSITKFYGNKGWKGCVCHEDFQGPKCLVPTYQNPFEDWDAEPPIPWISPYIPNFLAFWVTLVVLALTATLVFAWKWRQDKRAAHLEAMMVQNIHSHSYAHHSDNNNNSSYHSGSTDTSGGYHRIPTTEMTAIKAKSSSHSDQNETNRHQSEYATVATHHINQTLYQAL